MSCNFDAKKFKQYFHYGLNYEKNDILDSIILNCSKDKDFQSPTGTSDRLSYQLDVIQSMYVQFKRFIDLTSNHQQQWYQKITKKDVEDEILQRIAELKKNGFVSFIEDTPLRGIYTTGGKDFHEKRLTEISDKNLADWSTNKPLWGTYITYPNISQGISKYYQVPSWIREDILSILKYLRELEIENPYQYFSLFMDTKYARIINCENGNGADKTKLLYQKFMDMVKPAKADVYQLFSKKPTTQQENYIQENCADYWTLTDLKQQATSDKYKKKVQQCCEAMQQLEDEQIDL